MYRIEVAEVGNMDLDHCRLLPAGTPRKEARHREFGSDFSGQFSFWLDRAWMDRCAGLGDRRKDQVQIVH